MTITNTSHKDIDLFSANVSSEIAQQCELHTSFKGKSAHGFEIQKTEPLSRLRIPPNNCIFLKHGKEHLMLLNLKRPLRKGDIFDLFLNVGSLGTCQVKIPIYKALHACSCSCSSSFTSLKKASS